MGTETFTVEYPFIRCIGSEWGEDGTVYFLSWRPGIDYRMIGYHGDDSEEYANAMGKMHLTVVSTHKPGRYPERVFYTRQWESPDGKRFGKAGLKIATTYKFKRLCRGYLIEFVLAPGELHDDVQILIGKKAKAAAAKEPEKLDHVDLPF